MDLVKRVENPKYQLMQTDVDSVKFLFTLKNNDEAVDLTGTTLRIAIMNPNNDSLSQDCVITDAVNGLFECLLDESCYAILGQHEAEIVWYKETEVNTSYPFYYESIETIPIV